MKKRFNLVTVAVLLALMCVLTYVFTYSYSFNAFQKAMDSSEEQQKKLMPVSDALANVEKHFVGEWTQKDLTDGAVRGMIANLGDRWSHYLTAEEYAAYAEGRENLHIGIGVTAAYDEETGGLLITEVYSGSPAEEAGIVPHDIIMKIDGTAVSEVGYYQAVELVRGEEGTFVGLNLLTADGGSRTAVVERRAIIHEIVTSKIYGTAGYIKVLNFDARVDSDFSEAVDRLLDAGVESLIFDMRDNPGGMLTVLVNMLDRLLPEGALITMRDKTGAETPYTSGPEFIDLPMTVLVNADSYSAAEFFAACLQEYGKAEIIGEKTVGKGYAQTTYVLSDGSALLLSSSEYFTPSGKSLAGVGLTPDYEIIFTDEEKLAAPTMTPEEDRQLQKALEVLGVVS